MKNANKGVLSNLLSFYREPGPGKQLTAMCDFTGANLPYTTYRRLFQCALKFNKGHIFANDKARQLTMGYGKCQFLSVSNIHVYK